MDGWTPDAPVLARLPGRSLPIRLHVALDKPLLMRQAQLHAVGRAEARRLTSTLRRLLPGAAGTPLLADVLVVRVRAAGGVARDSL